METFSGKVYLPALEKRMNFNERIDAFMLLLLTGEELPPAAATTAADAHTLILRTFSKATRR